MAKSKARDTDVACRVLMSAAIEELAESDKAAAVMAELGFAQDVIVRTWGRGDDSALCIAVVGKSAVKIVEKHLDSARIEIRDMFREIVSAIGRREGVHAEAEGEREEAARA